MTSPVLAMAKETFLESRGFLPLFIALAASLLLAAVGLGLPAPMDAQGPPAGAFLHAGLSLIMSLTAMAYGASAMASDRLTGFSDLLLAKPVSGPVYFIGRFLGLGLRLTLLLALAVLLGSAWLFLLAPDTKYAEVLVADKFFLGEHKPTMNQPVLLRPNGPVAEWIYSLSSLEGETSASLRFRFKTRYPKGEELAPNLLLRIHVSRGSRTLLEEELEIRNRKSLDCSFPMEGTGDLHARLQVTGTSNFLEINGHDGTLVYGARSCVYPLLVSALSFLPILYLSLAVAMLFSTFVSMPTAFFACAVLSLITLTSPSLKANLKFSLAHEHKPPSVFPHAASKVLGLLPDPLAGGGMGALSRVECPTEDDVVKPWKEGLPHLLVVMVLGSLLAGRKKS